MADAMSTLALLLSPCTVAWSSLRVQHANRSTVSKAPLTFRCYSRTQPHAASASRKHEMLVPLHSLLCLQEDSQHGDTLWLQRNSCQGQSSCIACCQKHSFQCISQPQQLFVRAPTAPASAAARSHSRSSQGDAPAQQGGLLPGCHRGRWW